MLLVLGLLYYLFAGLSAYCFAIALIRILYFEEREFAPVTRDYLLIAASIGVLSLIIKSLPR